MAKVKKDESTGCWNWHGCKNTYGYGEFHRRQKRGAAHRVSYIALVGNIDSGLELDHICRNRACVNPAHLEPVTHQENILRGDSPTAKHAKATHCPKGHPYDEINTYYYRGSRRCERCRSNASKRQWIEIRKDPIRLANRKRLARIKWLKKKQK